MLVQFKRHNCTSASGNLFFICGKLLFTQSYNIISNSISRYECNGKWWILFLQGKDECKEVNCERGRSKLLPVHQLILEDEYSSNYFFMTSKFCWTRKTRNMRIIQSFCSSRTKKDIIHIRTISSLKIDIKDCWSLNSSKFLLVFTEKPLYFIHLFLRIDSCASMEMQYFVFFFQVFTFFR